MVRLWLVVRLSIYVPGFCAIFYVLTFFYHASYIFFIIFYQAKSHLVYLLDSLKNELELLIMKVKFTKVSIFTNVSARDSSRSIHCCRTKSVAHCGMIVCCVVLLLLVRNQPCVFVGDICENKRPCFNQK